MCPMAICPSQQQLSDYVFGKLSDGDSEMISEHLNVCEDCLSRIESVDQAADSVVQKAAPARAG